MKAESAVISINATSGDLNVTYDPNWDDQKLMINCKLNKPCTCPSGQALKSSVEFQEAGNGFILGIIFTAGQKGGGIQMTIGQGENGLMGVTEDNALDPVTIKYSVISQTAWTVTLLFEDL